MIAPGAVGGSVTVPTATLRVDKEPAETGGGAQPIVSTPGIETGPRQCLSGGPAALGVSPGGRLSPSCADLYLALPMGQWH